MDKLSLAALLNEDREMVLSNLAEDRTLAASQATLEKAVDRVMYRYVEGCDDEALRNTAQYILQAIRNTLPLMDAVGEARAWKRAGEPDRGGRAMPGPLAVVLLCVGALLVLAAVIGVMIAGRMGGALAFLEALLPVALGCGALYASGILSTRPKRRRRGDAPEEAARTEYLVDAEKAWHCLVGAMVQADGQLEHAREENAIARQRASDTAEGAPMSSEALELFGELLESAYAAGDEGAKEAVSSISFYLHHCGVDVTDYAQGREAWFEFLPAARPGTIRPALVAEGRLVKKGLASAQR